VLEEAFAAYDAFREGLYPSLLPTRPFAEHLAWLRGLSDDAAERHWRELLRGFRAPTPLPGGRPVRAGDAPDPVPFHTRLPAATPAALRTFAGRHGQTLSPVVHRPSAVLASRCRGGGARL